MMTLLLVVLLVVLLIPLSAVILDSQVGRALAARVERDGIDSGTRNRLDSLEAEVERLSREVLRLDEETQFLQRLLEGKPPSGEKRLPPRDEDR